MKYKSCCNRVCLLSHCEFRDAGGCYCVCNLKDIEHSLQMELSGEFHRNGSAIVYRPGINIPPTNEVRIKLLEQLERIKEKLKKYEPPCDSEEAK